MKSSRIILTICVSVFVHFHSVAADTVRTQNSASTKKIESALREFFTAMSKRDVNGLQAVLDTRLMAVEAGQPNAQLHVIDTGNTAEILPPKGNDDWDRAVLSAVKAETSATHPSVATASFTLTFPLSDEVVTKYAALLKNSPAKLKVAQKEQLAKLIKDRAIHNLMFAVLARRDGKWKIVCMSLPK